MRKKVVTGMLAVMLVFMMTGCCLSHDWQEATCTEPKTCSKCGETEGEALGHIWEEATCIEPKICRKCGETEGEVSGHTLSEATYWEAAVCSVCGETAGDVLIPAFEELGVKGQFMEVGKTCDYNTLSVSRSYWEKDFVNALKESYLIMDEDGTIREVEGDYEKLEDFFLKGVYGTSDGDASNVLLNGEIVKLTEENIVAYEKEQHNLTGNYGDLTELYADIFDIDLDARTTAQATVTDYQIFDSDETHEAKDGYEWKTVEMQIEYKDTPYMSWNVVYCHDNYYEKDEEGTQEDGEFEPSWDNDALYTVNWKGQDYTECRAIIANTSNTDWVEDAEGSSSLTYTIKVDFLYPKGYDGGLLCLYDAENLCAPVNFAYADDNTLFFRLQ